MATTYTLEEIRQEVAENIGLDDGADGVLDDKIMTSAMLDKYINRSYFELVSLLIGKYPEDYQRMAYADFWKADGAILTITDDTLVATGSIFVNGMVGDTIYNQTKGTSAVIESYTNGTTVVLSTEPEWDAADVIYILGHEFALGGGAIDARYVTNVAVKYYTSDLRYRPLEWLGASDVNRTGFEVRSPYAGRVYKTNLKVGDSKVSAIGILPEPTVPITRGIQITYIEQPSKLDENDDVPELPLGSQHALIAGATVSALKKLRRLDEVPVYLQEWQQARAEVIGNYARSRVQNQSGKRSTNYLLRMRYV